MQCPECGASNLAKANFCTDCGVDLRPAAELSTAQPAPTVIIQERERRSVPGIVWMLLGMVLVVLICGVVLWFGLVDMPEQVRERLPGPLAALVDAVEDARDPDPPVPEDPGEDESDGNETQEPPPGEETEEVVQQPDQPPLPQPEATSEACDEDLAITSLATSDEYYTGMGSLIIHFADRLESEYYDVSIVHEATGLETSRVTCQSAYEPDTDEDRRQYLCAGGGYTFEWYAGRSTVSIHPDGQDCILDEIQLLDDCPSGQEWYANWPHGSPRGCCTLGCYCYDASYGWGCWLNCAPACYE